MTDILLFGILAVDALILARMLVKPAATDSAPVKEPPEQEADEAVGTGKKFDDGFENIMRYSVRGKDGFGN